MGSAALNDRRANIDVVLTNLSIGIPTDQDFIGDRLLPALPQALSTVRMPVWGTEAFRIREDRVGDYSIPDKLDITVDTTSVDVDGHALSGQVSDRHQIEAQRGPLNYDLANEVLVTVVGQMDLAREKMQADLMTSTSIYGSTHKIDLNGTSGRWDDVNVDPTDNLIDAIENVIPNDSGKRPNTLWMGQEVWAKLIQNPKLKNRLFGSTQAQPIPTTAQVASLLGISNLYVGRAVSRTSGGTVSHLWGKNAGLLFVPPTAGKRVPAFGYTVEQTVFGGASEQVVRIRDEQMGASGGELIKRSSFYTPISIFPNAGFLYYNAVA
jgi:Phage major capsid protein E